jgi:ANTAR domain
VGDPDAAVIVPGAFAVLPPSDFDHGLGTVLSEAAAARERLRELRQRAACIRAETAVLRQAMVSAWEAIRERQSLAAPRELPHPTKYDRMVAQLQTMPVIEQAKGIIMAQSRCGEAEAFDILRRVSQAGNTPVRDLATQIVAKAAG